MIADKKNWMRPAASIALAGLVALGLAACEKSPPPPPAPKPAVQPVPVKPAPAPAPAPQEAPPPAASQPQGSSADRALEAKVKAALGTARGVDAGGIDVQASGGKVKLFGTTDTAAQRNAAAKAAKGVAGVKGVENHIAVVSGS